MGLGALVVFVFSRGFFVTVSVVGVSIVVSTAAVSVIVVSISLTVIPGAFVVGGNIGGSSVGGVTLVVSLSRGWLLCLCENLRCLASILLFFPMCNS